MKSAILEPSLTEASLDQQEICTDIATTIYPCNDNSATRIEIIVPASAINAMVDHIASIQQETLQAPGFSLGEAPTNFIKEQYKTSILEHATEIFLKFSVFPHLYRTLREQGISYTIEPQFVSLKIDYDYNATFCFEVTTVPIIVCDDWKFFPFRAPRRKNYKDLDRQAESFLTQEQELRSKHSKETVTIGDWIGCDISITDKYGNNVEHHSPQQFWFKLNAHEGEGLLQDIFIDRTIGQRFLTSSDGIQEFVSGEIRSNHTFAITINHLVHNNYFCIDKFKTHFRLKTAKDVHQKLIEVFSFRNDMCLRRSIVNEVMKLLLTRFGIKAPKSLVEQQQQIIFDELSTNPDYYVYRAQKDFQAQVKKLAERQAGEFILIDQIVHQERMTVSDDDIKGYLNLSNRPRTKELLYFRLPRRKVNGQDTPIHQEEITLTCLREKMLNQIIYRLTHR